MAAFQKTEGVGQSYDIIHRLQNCHNLESFCLSRQTSRIHMPTADRSLCIIHYELESIFVSKQTRTANSGQHKMARKCTTETGVQMCSR
jgi:hypothetical protein